MDGKTYHLEAFSCPLKGRRIWISAHPTVAAGRFAACAAELSHRARHIVIITGSGGLPKWADGVRIDVLYRVVDSVDLKLVLQAIQTKPVPTICLWIGPAPPAAVFSFFQRLVFVTLLVSGEGAPIEDYDAVFWPVGGGASQEAVESILIRKMGSAKATEVAVGTIMKELRASNVGLVWSCIEESEKSGCVYWFDPFEFELGEGPRSVQDLFEQLRYNTDLLEKAIVGR
jgi:hypothetical protein